MSAYQVDGNQCADWFDKPTLQENLLILDGIARITAATLKNATRLVTDHGLLKTWHKTLFQKVVPIYYYAGVFRGDDPSYPCLRVSISVGGNPGFDYGVVSDAMSQFTSEIITNDNDLQAFLSTTSKPAEATMARMAMIAGTVGTFIRIHPFLNGNGRISRLLANYLAHRYALNFPFQEPSTRPSSPDYGAASGAAMRDDLDPLIDYFLNTIGSVPTP